MLNAPERLAASLRASEAADAIGLNYRFSRAKLWRILHGLEPPPAPTPELQRRFDLGKLHEPLAESCYRDSYEHTFIERQTTRTAPFYSYTLAATPDIVVERGEHVRIVVELKCVCDDGVLPKEPRAVHVIQCVVQMYVVGAALADLFYYVPLTGQHQRFHLAFNLNAWNATVSHWLREFLDAPPQRMPPGEATRRERQLLALFWS